MKKTAIVLGIVTLTLFACRKYDKPNLVSKDSEAIANTILSKSLVSVDGNLNESKQAGMTNIKFGELRKMLGKIETKNIEIDDNTMIHVVSALNYNITKLSYHKLIDDFNTLYIPENTSITKSYQEYAKESNQMILGCVGKIDDEKYQWKVMVFFPEKNNQEQQDITMK